MSTVRAVLADEKYILFTTYRRDGTPVSTPVWVVGLDKGELGFATSSATGKAKRLAHTDRVQLQPCNARGVITSGSEPVTAVARIVTGSERDAIRSKIVAKYGVVITTLVKVIGIATGLAKGKRVPYGDFGIVITLAS